MGSEWFAIDKSVRHQMALKFAAQMEQCKREEAMRDGE